MPRFRIHMINSEFQSFEDGEYESVEAALNANVSAAAAVATEAVIGGEANTAIEIHVELNGKVVGRRVLSMSVSNLISDEAGNSA